jgi:hypothetical protein
MGQISVSGTLLGGPPTGGTVFPAAQFQTPLGLSQSPKGFQVASGILTRILTDASVFVVLSAVGLTRDVPKANFIYIRAESDFDLRVTQDDGLGGSTVSTSHHRGLYMAEFPDNKAVTLLEVAASTKLEYFASGN